MDRVSENFPAADEMRHMIPLDCIAGFDVRPGFYIYEGATPIPNGVNFTVHSHGATSCELLLYHRMTMPVQLHYLLSL